MAQELIRVRLWRRNSPEPYKWVEVLADPSNKHLSDPFTYLPEVVVCDGILFVRQKSGSYREATVHRDELGPRATLYLLDDAAFIPEYFWNRTSWWRKVLDFFK